MKGIQSPTEASSQDIEILKKFNCLATKWMRWARK